MNATRNFDEHYVIEVPHTAPVKWWSCESFWDTAVNDDEIDYQTFSSITDAKEFFDDDVPGELVTILAAGKEAIAVRSYNDDDWSFFDTSEFDREGYAMGVFSRDLSSMIVLDSIKDIEYEISHRTGHKADEIRGACREIMERVSK